MGRAIKGREMAQDFAGRGRAQGGNVRRRRKTKYTWLPTLGADKSATGADELTFSNGFSWSATADKTDVALPANIALFPLVEDTPQEEVVGAGNPLVTFIGNDYVIKRIVGKIFVECEKVAADTYRSVVVTAGMFVARVDDQSAGGALPVGASTTTLALHNYDPNFVDNIREPWIWRRSWILSNPSSTNADATQAIHGNFPSSNCNFGSVQDGPHIDAKTGRRIRNDERLFFAATARGFSSTGLDYAPQPATDLTVAGYLDIRVLGALRRARNRSNF